ncbi:MarR family winged helix-turn-helix transcriptional regulator [Amnibacterium sp.]|uniref:MarR family winged helix-turn-helix transcriptional regulator n=1 Tax=Amnibacterium sp. TaxID=1872496 RepID=UPI003F7CD324
MLAETDEVIRASRALLGIVAVGLQPTLERVTLPQIRALVLLSSLGPLRIGVLGDLLEVAPSTCTRLVDRLQRGGWVERRTLSPDRREVTVALTDAGSELVREVTEDRRRRVDRILGVMQPPERAALVAALRRFSDISGEADGDLLTLGL